MYLLNDPQACRVLSCDDNERRFKALPPTFQMPNGQIHIAYPFRTFCK